MVCHLQGVDNEFDAHVTLELAAALAIVDRLGAISATAYKSFRDTDPTTLKGHAEKFAYVLEREETFMSDDGVTYEAFASVLRSMQKFAA
jgi:hypothetical protein